MTNNELISIINTIQINNDNIFDIYLELSKYQSEYIEMDIAKIIPTIYEAYKIYSDSTPAWEKIINKILHADYTQIIEQFDISKMLEKIPEEYRELFGDLLN